MKEKNPTHGSYETGDLGEIKKKVLNWLPQFSTFCFLDNHQYQLPGHSEECLVAAGVKRTIKYEPGVLDALDIFTREKKSWLFGHLGYDLKNEIENLSSSHPDGIGFSPLFFFEPAIVLKISAGTISIEADAPDAVFAAIRQTAIEKEHSPAKDTSIQSRLSKNEYVAIIKKLQQHILRGDCYEINYCQEFFAGQTAINPVEVFQQLSTASPNPFAALYRLDNQWLLCASPERYLQKKGNRILSQPIKGTAARDLLHEEQDKINKAALLHSEKDRSENVMVVDLVRNDLSKVCEEGTVKVDELFGIYSFPQVHQMISTISGELKTGASFSDIIKASFPMGSMTGAPKKRVMELIEQYEKTKRGIFSGAVGYISPDGDFDFNVVIRSIMYNAATDYLSFQAGSAITFYSDPEKEWEECLLKAAVLKKVLNDTAAL